VARAHALPLDVHRLESGGLTDLDGGMADAYGLSPTGAVIVRPDGFVGWRAHSSAGDPEWCATVLADAFETLLCRRAAGKE
jgi:putative polyketide hydroxylase